MISGTEILVRSLSKPSVVDQHGTAWNYHSRSDRHSKIACWAIVFDLLRVSNLFRAHVASGKVCFGINHEMRDFRNDRKKDLDLVISLPASTAKAGSRTLASLAEHHRIELTAGEIDELRALPELRQAPVGNVLVALEAKACMTAHQKALPRLYDELNSSHQTIHGSHDLAIAAGFVMVNAARKFLSPGRNERNHVSDEKWNVHDQPKSVNITMDKVKQLPRRSKAGTEGYDALSIVVVDCPNDGSKVELVSAHPAPQAGEVYHYTSMIDRLRGLYDTRFGQI